VKVKNKTTRATANAAPNNFVDLLVFEAGNGDFGFDGVGTGFSVFDPDCGWRVFCEEFFRARRSAEELTAAVWTGEMQTGCRAVATEGAFEGADECV
jgi:hypothetical protein